MKELLTQIAKALVDNQGAVKVNAIAGQQITILELTVDIPDQGKVIGRAGKTADAIRLILNAAGAKVHHRYTLEILE